uniref:Uncharacterized protein n=1 Tax=Arundo donax TaxID=35708 RepID=A0A0A9HKI1_ARUDO
MNCSSFGQLFSYQILILIYCIFFCRNHLNSSAALYIQKKIISSGNKIVLGYSILRRCSYVVDNLTCC